jgi:hypothetical protein
MEYRRFTTDDTPGLGGAVLARIGLAATFPHAYFRERSVSTVVLGAGKSIWEARP